MTQPSFVVEAIRICEGVAVEIEAARQKVVTG